MADFHLQALTLARNGQWDAAHDIIQKHSDSLSCHIHACLHRIEGDLPNARYWYGRAGVAVTDEDTAKEIQSLIEGLEAG